MNELEKKELESTHKALTLKAQADAVIVSNKEQYDTALKIDGRAREAKKAFHVWFDPIDDASKKQRQATIKQGKKIDEPLDYVIKTVSKKTSAWYAAEQARILEAQRKAEEIARKKAEEEALKAAEELEKQGMTAAADAVLDNPIAVPKVEVPVFEKAEGVSYRKQYSAEVVSLMDLVKAVASGSVPIAYISANTTALNSWARSTKGSDSIPGVKVVTENIQSRRM